MSAFFGPPVFAWIQELFTLVIILVSIISWIIRTIQGNNQQLPPPVQRPGKRGADRIGEEFDSFMKGMNRGDARNSPSASSAKPVDRPAPAKNRGNPPISQRPPERQNQPKESGKRREQPQSRKASGGTKPSESVFGNVPQSDRQAKGDPFVVDARRDMGQGVSDSVQKHLGGAFANTPRNRANTVSTDGVPQVPGCCVGAAESLRSLLRSPQSIRQAIIVQEVLNRPKCLRK